jgi:hypothetical protein
VSHRHRAALEPIRVGERFRIGLDEHVVSELIDEGLTLQVTRLRDGRILRFAALELRDGRHVEWLKRGSEGCSRRSSIG